MFANFRDDNVSIIIFLLWFWERDLLEWLAGLEPVQDGYDNKKSDRAESDDKLSHEDESDEEE